MTPSYQLHAARRGAPPGSGPCGHGSHSLSCDSPSMKPLTVTGLRNRLGGEGLSWAQATSAVRINPVIARRIRDLFRKGLLVTRSYFLPTRRLLRSMLLRRKLQGLSGERLMASHSFACEGLPAQRHRS